MSSFKKCLHVVNPARDALYLYSYPRKWLPTSGPCFFLCTLWKFTKQKKKKKDWRISQGVRSLPSVDTCNDNTSSSTIEKEGPWKNGTRMCTSCLLLLLLLLVVVVVVVVAAWRPFCERGAHVFVSTCHASYVSYTCLCITSLHFNPKQVLCRGTCKFWGIFTF